MKLSIKHLIFAVPFLFFIALWVQQKSHYFREFGLEMVRRNSPGKFSFQNVLKGTFQKQHELYLNDNFGYSPNFARAWRQMDYTCFKQFKTGDITVAKDNSFLYTPAIDVYNAKIVTTPQIIRERISVLKQLQNTLAQQNKHLIVVLAPDKASFFKELIPTHLSKIRGVNNIKLFESEAIAQEFTYLNFNNWFIKMKDTSQFPLYPKYGMHWSEYGGGLALDSLTNYMRVRCKLNVPKIQRTTIAKKQERRGQEYDLLSNANLLTNPIFDTLAFPCFADIDTLATKRISVLALADSYYRTLYDLSVTPHLFKQHSYVFYNRTFKYSTASAEAPINQFSLENAVTKSDVIIVMVTSINIEDIGWGWGEKINAFYAKRKK